MQDLSIIILAAGKGTRMKSNLPKVMHKIANREMINLVIDEAKKLNPKNIQIVISDEMKEVANLIYKTHLQTEINFTIQKERNGTGHAVSCAICDMANIGNKVLVLYGDTPLIKEETLNAMAENLNSFEVSVLGFENHEENSYGRLVINGDELEKIVEFKDANNDEKSIPFCNSGVMAISGKEIKNYLNKINNNNAAKEYYLTDIAEIAKNQNHKVGFIITNEEEVLGVNSRLELARAEAIKQSQISEEMMKNGVTLLDPFSVYFSFDTKIANDVIIDPHVYFGAKVEVSQNVQIKAFSHLEACKILNNAIIGPFARIRPGTLIDEDVKIGNFVEVKKSEIKKGAKINHLSYIGDAEIGENANIGAGTITCNYDGYEKFQTKIGDNAFIGSNSSLVAPVEIESNSLVAAGSVITKKVEKDSIAIARSKQYSIENGAKKFRERKLAKIKETKDE